MEQLAQQHAIAIADALEDGALKFNELFSNRTLPLSAGVREIDPNQPIILIVTAASHQTGLFHSLEHVGHGGPLNRKLVGDFRLRHAIVNEKTAEQGGLGAVHGDLIHESIRQCPISLAHLGQQFPVSKVFFVRHLVAGQ